MRKVKNFPWATKKMHSWQLEKECQVFFPAPDQSKLKGPIILFKNG
jgi:hypothetical protein